MKFLSKIVLFIFVTFLATPTIVTLIEKNTDTSIFFSFAEEEESIKDIKVIKAYLKQQFDYPFLVSNIKHNTIIISENLSLHDNVISTIFSPPPELV